MKNFLYFSTLRLYINKIVFSQNTKLPHCTKSIQQNVQQMSIYMYLDNIKNKTLKIFF